MLPDLLLGGTFLHFLAIIEHFFTNRKMTVYLCYIMSGGERTMKSKAKLLQTICTLSILIAQVAVNSTCCFRYYQDELSPALNSLRKYHED